MTEFQAAAVMVGLFALRCVVPLIVTVGLCYLMNQLVKRWELQEEEAGALTGSAPAAGGAIPLAGAVPVEPLLSLPCWITQNCEETKRATCAAVRLPGVPCWQARRETEGALPDPCPPCPRYVAAQASGWLM
jgi:hypothetical protein